MVSLRHKLGVGFGGLLLITLALGLYGIVLLSELGSAVDVVLRENYRSVAAMEEVRAGVERLDRAALTALLGDEAGAARIAASADAAVRDAIDVELGNITLPGERERAERLDNLYARYHDAQTAVLAPAPSAARSATNRRADYEATLRKLREAIAREAAAILAMNQAHMLAADEAVREKATAARRRMGGLLVLGVLAAAGVVVYLNRSILPPLRRLTQSAHAIRDGDLDLVVAASAKDEIGELAGAFNAMAEQLRTLRRSDRARLVRVQNAMQVAIDHLPDAVAVLNPSGEVEMANAAARRLFHLVPGRKPQPDEYFWLSLLLDEPAAAEAFRKDRFDEAIQVFDDGVERFFLPQAIPVHDMDRLLVGALYVFSDVTHLRRAYEARADLLSRVAHELGSPLTSLRMALHLVLEEKYGGLQPKAAELLLAARDDAERLHRISAGLRDLGTHRATRPAATLAPVAAATLVERATQRVRAACRQQGITLATDLPDGLPDVRADAELVPAVLAHLLDNALDATREGGTVRIGAAPAEGDAVTFFVEDTGAGISPEHLPHLFEPFYRPVRPDGEMRHGLGLPVAQQIVEAHGSRIEVDSTEGAGSRFAFTLPTGDDRDGRLIADEHPFRNHPLHGHPS